MVTQHNVLTSPESPYYAGEMRILILKACVCISRSGFLQLFIFSQPGITDKGQGGLGVGRGGWSLFQQAADEIGIKMAFIFLGFLGFENLLHQCGRQQNELKKKKKKTTT